MLIRHLASLSLLTLSFYASSYLLIADEVVVDLKNPTYCEGVLKTDCGGVLKTDCLRIQAEKICYHQEGRKISRVVAEGHLMLLYKSRLFVGKRLEYDFVSKTGQIFEGRFVSDPWFVSGKRIQLRCDGSFFIHESDVTTCEDEDYEFYIRSQSTLVYPNRYAKMKDITFCFFDTPCIWIPQYTANLGSEEGIPMKFQVGLGGYRGIKFTAKYKFLSGDNWKTFARFDYTLARGPGAGIETDYHDKALKRCIRTRSYMARDISYDDPHKRIRYRFQGCYDEFFCRDNITVHAAYDRLSDSEMAADYSYREFELPTGKRTEFSITKQDRNWITDLSARVRVNNFQVVNQQLPSLTGSYRPFTIGSTGIISDFSTRTEYLNYVYANGTPGTSDFDAARIEVAPRFYRPFIEGPVTITPEVGGIGVFYSNNPEGNAVGQVVGTLGVDANAHFYRYFGDQKHILEPYVQYRFCTHPVTAFRDQFIFDIDDGFARLNMVRLGVANNIYRRNACGVPFKWIGIDIWADAFINTPTVEKSIPKIYAELQWRISPRICTTIGTAWNNTNNCPDYSNLAVEWTVNRDLAFTAEYRARGPRCWRKGDPTNFILDSFRSVDELEASPLSDQRNIFLTHLYYRLHPDWSLEIETRNGWNRRKTTAENSQPSYFEYKIDLAGAIHCGWSGQIGYEHRTNEDRYSVGVSMGRRLPCRF
jgi:hypothetical protein